MVMVMVMVSCGAVGFLRCGKAGEWINLLCLWLLVNAGSESDCIEGKGDM